MEVVRVVKWMAMEEVGFWVEMRQIGVPWSSQHCAYVLMQSALVR